MVMGYGHMGMPETEAERLRRELLGQYGLDPGAGMGNPHASPPVDVPTAALGVSGSTPGEVFPGVAPGMADRALAVSGERPGTMPFQQPELPDDTLPERPPDVGGPDWVDVVDLSIRGAADALRAPMGAYTGNISTSALDRLRAIEGRQAAKQARQDQNWQQDVQNVLANRRLRIAEGQEARAGETWREPRDPNSALSRSVQDVNVGRAERGHLPGTDPEQIRGMSAQAIEASGLQKEAGTYRGVEQNIAQADAAQERRMGEESTDAQEELGILQAIGYPGSEQVQASDPQTVARFVQVAESQMNRDQRAQLERMRAAARAKKSAGDGAPKQRPFMTTQDLISSPEHVRVNYINELERELSQAQKSQDRMVLTYELQQAQNVQNRQIDGLEYIGDVLPKESQYNKATALKKSMDEFELKTAEGLAKAQELGRMMEGLYGLDLSKAPDAYSAYKQLKSIQEQREAIGREIYGFGAPQAHEKMPIKDAVGDLTSWIGLAAGAAQQVAANNVNLVKAQGYKHLRSLQYIPVQEQQQEAPQEAPQGPPVPDGQQAPAYDDDDILNGLRKRGL